MNLNEVQQQLECLRYSSRQEENQINKATVFFHLRENKNMYFAKRRRD